MRRISATPSLDFDLIGEQGESESGESGVDEVDDDDLRCGEEPRELARGHRFGFGTAFGLGLWAKTSRKSFSSSRASSRSAATARS